MSTPRKRDTLDALWESYTAALQAPINSTASSGRWVVLALLMFGILGLTTSSLFINDMFLDVFVPLDGAQRVSHGQWPHRDFFTPIGAAYYGFLKLATLLVGTSPIVVAWAAYLPAPFLAGAAFVLGRNRLPAPLAVLTAVYIGALACSPRTMGTLAISWLATYNKHGWAALCVVVLAVLIRSQSKHLRDKVVDILVTTACTLLCFYLKVTYFVAAGAYLLFAWLFLPGRRALAFASGVSTLVVLGLLTLLGDHNWLYLADLQRAASSASVDLLRGDRALDIALGNQITLTAMGVFILYFLRESQTVEEETDASGAIGVLLGASAICIFITLQSHDAQVPVLPMIGLYVLDCVRTRAIQRGDQSYGALTVVGAAIVILFAVPISLDVGAFQIFRMAPYTSAVPVVTSGRLQNVYVPDADQSESLLPRFISGELTGTEFDNSGSPWPVDTGPLLMDGEALLERHQLQESRILSLTFTQVYPWLMDIEPALHQVAWYDNERTFSVDSLGSVQQQLDSVDTILVPKAMIITNLWEAYQPHVVASFEKLDETPIWVLWVKR